MTLNQLLQVKKEMEKKLNIAYVNVHRLEGSITTIDKLIQLEAEIENGNVIEEIKNIEQRKEEKLKDEELKPEA